MDVDTRTEAEKMAADARNYEQFLKDNLQFEICAFCFEEESRSKCVLLPVDGSGRLWDRIKSSACKQKYSDLCQELSRTEDEGRLAYLREFAAALNEYGMFCIILVFLVSFLI